MSTHLKGKIAWVTGAGKDYQISKLVAKKK